MHKDRNNYTLTDFLTDETFKKWVLDHKRGKASSSDWAVFLEVNPQLTEIAAEAKELIEVMGTTTTDSDRASRERSWEVIAQELGMARETSRPAKLAAKRLKLDYAWMGMAASLLLLAVSAFFLGEFKEEPEFTLVMTGAEEYREILLPDSSRITLGGNSRLRYEAWTDEQVREIWLEGNAHLEINHLHEEGNPIRKADRFLVHLPDSNVVEVLGTTFNISALGEKQLVQLLEGSINVSNLQYSFLMKPGESVTLQSTGEMEINQARVLPIWKQKELQVKGATAREIIDFVELHFQVQLQVPSELDLGQQLNGIFPMDSAESVAASLTVILSQPILVY